MDYELFVEEFKHLVMDELEQVPGIGGGMLRSEMLAYTCCAIAQGVEVVVESGRCRGYSTECLARCLPNTKIISIERAPLEEYDEKLRGFPNLEMIRGDGESQVANHIKGRCSLLLDGPKGFRAFEIIEKNRDRICFGGIHDLCASNEFRAELNKRKEEAWYTDSDGFVQRYGHLEDSWWKPRDSYSSREQMTAESFCLGMFKGGLWREQ